MTKRRLHTPARVCVGCNTRDDRSQMDRFTLVEGRLQWDLRGRAPGRGAYLHRDPRCREGFVARKPYLRSLQASIAKAQRVQLFSEVS